MSQSQPVADVRVYVSASPGEDIDGSSDQLALKYVPTAIVRTAGGQRLDYATFVYDLTRDGERIRNMSVPANWSLQVEVRKYTGSLIDPEDEESGDAFVPLFWGDITQQRLHIGREETVTVTASIFPYHFGGPLKGPRYYDPFGTAPDDYLDVHERVEFNPLIDGIIEPNMATGTLIGMGSATYNIWTDPESYRTPEAEAVQDRFGKGGRESWTLADAVHTLCWVCNPNELWIKNPTLVDLTSELSTSVAIENIVLPFGNHLPFYLDELLHRYGFDWEVELTQDPDNPTLTRRAIRVFSRIVGTSKTVRMQDVGGSLDLATTNCKALDVTMDVGNVTNQVTIAGEYREGEATLTLYRTWPVADDTLTADDLDKSNLESDYHAEGKQNVWRKWAAGEAGDYTSDDNDGTMRPTEAELFQTLTAIQQNGTDHVLPRRRRIEDRLLKGQDGKRLPPLVEYFDPDAGDEGEWKPVPDEWPHNILAEEIGIVFTGTTPPEELLAFGDDAKLRITGTVATDEAISSHVESTLNTPLLRDSALMIDMHDRFFMREFDGDYSEPEPPTGAEYDERDDTTAIEDYANSVLREEESAQVHGTFTLIGINTEYAIGDEITKVEGREISLNLNSSLSETSRYLTVTGISYHPQDQETILETRPQAMPPYFFRKPSG